MMKETMALGIPNRKKKKKNQISSPPPLSLHEEKSKHTFFTLNAFNSLVVPSF